MRTIQRFCILFLLTGVFLAPGSILASAAAAEFEKGLTSGGITFHVASVTAGAYSRVKINLSGAGVDPGPVESRIEGTVTWAEVTDDLDNDGSPELYVYATCPDEVSSATTRDAFSAPPAAAVITRGPHAAHSDQTAVIAVPATGSSSAVVVGPAVAARTDSGIVQVVPVIPVESPEDEECIHELKFVLAGTGKAKTLKLQSRK